MGKIVTIVIVLALMVGITFSSCRKPVSFPNEPHIEFYDMIQYKDSIKIILYFTDGDGDIGLSERDTNSNLFLTYYEMMNSNWIQFGLCPLDTPCMLFPMNYKIPPINDSNEDKALEGEISVTIDMILVRPGADSIKYDIYIEDRAKNKSNTITTPTIVFYP